MREQRSDWILLSEEFDVVMGMHQVSVLSPFIFAVVVDVVTYFTRECALSELLYADDLVLMNETMEGHSDKLLKWEVAFGSKDLKVNLWNTKVNFQTLAPIMKDHLS